MSKGARMIMCKVCDKVWNVSVRQEVPDHGYLCPDCTHKMLEERRNEKKQK